MREGGFSDVSADPNHGAAGGQQGSTGRVIAKLLLEQGIPVRALVHKLDVRSDELRRASSSSI